MLEYDKIDISEGIGINKTSDSHECKVCRYWCFVKINFAYESLVHNGCHDMTQKSLSFNDFSVATVGRNGFRFSFGALLKVTS